MHVFIDTNIFLSFYHLTSEDLEELKKLVVLVKGKDIILHLPEQVIDETWRNRANKIKDKFESFKKEKFSTVFPAYCKSYKEYKSIREAQKECEKHHAAMIAQIEKDIDERKLEADLLLVDIFKLAKKIERSSDIMSKARERMEIGNPPGKKDSLGDAINWESLLTSVPKKIKLSIIADDADLYSPLDTSKLDEFLIHEWEAKKGSVPQFYRKLSDFFRKNYPDINLATEFEKDDLIEKLSSSGTFATTHSIIAALSNHSGFSAKQAEDLVKALLLNNQIRWIVSDDDVHNFYKKLYDDHFFSLFEHDEELGKLLAEPEELEEVPF